MKTTQEARKTLTVTKTANKHQTFICADVSELKRMQRWYNSLKENGIKKYTTSIS